MRSPPRPRARAREGPAVAWAHPRLGSAFRWHRGPGGRTARDRGAERRGRGGSASAQATIGERPAGSTGRTRPTGPCGIAHRRERYRSSWVMAWGKVGAWLERPVNVSPFRNQGRRKDGYRFYRHGIRIAIFPRSSRTDKALDLSIAEDMLGWRREVVHKTSEPQSPPACCRYSALPRPARGRGNSTRLCLLSILPCGEHPCATSRFVEAMSWSP
jgi:hypothetical protein